MSLKDFNRYITYFYPPYNQIKAVKKIYRQEIVNHTNASVWLYFIKESTLSDANLSKFRVRLMLEDTTHLTFTLGTT